MTEVVVVDPEGRRIEVRLEPGREYGIGRAQANDIPLADMSLSRRHARIYDADGQWLIEDCESSNGTFLDRVRLAGPAPLQPGACFTFGSCRLEVLGGSRPVRERVSYQDAPLAPKETVTITAADVDVALKAPAPASPADAEKVIELLRRRLGVVEKANLELLAHEPMPLLLPKILDLVFEAVKPDRAALLRLEDGELVCRAMRGAWGDGRVSISRTIAGMVLQERASVLTANAQDDSRFVDALSIVGGAPIVGLMAVPLWNNKEVIGLVYADSSLASQAFTPEDLRTLTMLANVAAIQIENAALFEEQVEKGRLIREALAAAEIQRGLLPAAAPVIEGFEFTGYNLPCHEVGGDYYDCLDLAGGRKALVIGDVAGKGMGAALLMAVLQATFHAQVETGPAPLKLVADLNRAACRSAPSNRFVTLFYADVDPASGRLQCVNAGHAPPPLVVRASGAIEEIASCGLPLGVFGDTGYTVIEVQLRPGDLLFACSDGVTDLSDPDGGMFGDDRLRELLAASAGKPVLEIRAALDRSLREHARGAPQPDDLTVVMLQRLG